MNVFYDRVFLGINKIGAAIDRAYSKPTRLLLGVQFFLNAFRLTSNAEIQVRLEFRKPRNARTTVGGCDTTG